MYAAHFGLGREPFSIAPDPRFLFMSERHREALAHLLYGLRGGGGFVLLTGEVGAGKTTVARCFLEQLPAHCVVAYIFNPRLTAIELLQTVCGEFGIEAPADRSSVKAHVDALNAFLLHGHAQGRQALLVIDEAQSLAPDVLEQLRLLTNLETNERKLLQIVLIGQPELRTMLAQPGLTQLAQRVIARYHLGPLTRGETQHYVGHRWAVAGRGAAAPAGSTPQPFDAAALAAVHQLAGGVPRRINLLAGRALLGAYASGARRVAARTVRAAAREVFDATGGPRQARRGTGWLAAAAVAAATALGVWAWQRAGTGARVPAPRTAAAVASEPAAAPAPTQAPAQAHAPPVASASAAPVGAAAMASAAATASAAGVAGGAPGPAPFERAALLAGAPGDESTAWRELALRWNVAIGEGDACRVAAQAQLACFRSATGGLALARQLGRPGWVTLHDGAAAPRHALLVELGREHATLQVGARRFRPTLAELGTLWRGDFATLWRTPPLWRDTPGASAVTLAPYWLQRQLAQVAPAAAKLPLHEQVIAFQRLQGVTADGLAGPLTLMLLGRAAGVDEPVLGDADAAGEGRK
jgi:general secretion pathway protein A